MEEGRVAFYHPWIKSKGGAERLLFEYAERSDFDVEILTHYQTANFEGYDTPIRIYGDGEPPTGFLKRGILQGHGILFSKLDLSDYDAFLVSEAGLGCLTTLRNYKKPTICYCHTPLRAAHQFYNAYRRKYGALKQVPFTAAVKTYKVLERRAWQKFDYIACNSYNTLKNIEKADLAAEKPKSVIYPGADVKSFRNEGAENFFFYPSRYKRYKRQDLAIEAFKQFKKKAEEDYRLILAGYPEDQEYLNELRTNSSEDIEIKTGLSDPKMRDLYSRCKAVLFTAKNEDWGIVPIEAMAAGKPVIAVEEGGPTESIEDGKTGFLVDNTSEALADKMQLLTTDSDRYKELSKQAKIHAQNFSWETFTEKLDTVVRDQL